MNLLSRKTHVLSPEMNALSPETNALSPETDALSPETNALSRETIPLSPETSNSLRILLQNGHHIFWTSNASVLRRGRLIPHSPNVWTATF